VTASERDFQAEADAALGQLTDGLAPELAARAVAILANRSAARLHALTRAEATARKDTPDWPGWAQLQNAARTMVLQASTCRDLALRLGGDSSKERA
jgi:hypothetical protein